MKHSIHILALIILLCLSSTLSVKLNTKFFSWFFLGRDETNLKKDTPEKTNQITKPVVDKDLGVEKINVPLLNIKQEVKPLRKDASEELNVINKVDSVSKPTESIVQKGTDDLKAKTAIIEKEEIKPKLINIVTEVSKPENIEKLGKMKTEKIIVEPVENKVEVIREEIQNDNGITSKKIIKEEDSSDNLEIQKDYYTKTEKCSEFNSYNCADICGVQKVNKCEQTANTFPEQLFRCSCGIKTSPWYYNDGTENIICPEQDLNLASVVLQKRRVAIEVINRMNEKDITQLVSNLHLDNEEKANLEDADKKETFFKTNNMLKEQPKDKVYLDAVKQAKDQKDAEKVLNNIDNYINDPSSYDNKDNLDEKTFNLNCGDLNEGRHC